MLINCSSTTLIFRNFFLAIFWTVVVAPLRVHIEKLSSLGHQLLPVSVPHRLVLQLDEQRDRILEALHVGLQRVPDAELLHEFRQFTEYPDEIVHTVDQLLGVQVRPEGLRPNAPHLLLLLVQFEQHLHPVVILLQFQEDRVIRSRKIEQYLGIDQVPVRLVVLRDQFPVFLDKSRNYPWIATIFGTFKRRKERKLIRATILFMKFSSLYNLGNQI